MIESVHIDCRNDMETSNTRIAAEVVSNSRHSAITPERVSQVFGVGLNTAKQTIAVTTQKGVRRAIHPLNRRYRVDHLDLHRNRLGGQWYVDHLLPLRRSRLIRTQERGYIRTATCPKFTLFDLAPKSPTHLALFAMT